MVKMEDFKSFKKDIIASLLNTPIEYVFSPTFSIAFDKVVIKRGSDNFIYLCLDESCNKDYMHKWDQTIGKFFYKDIKKNNLSDYYEVQFGNYKALIRTVKEDELNSLENNIILCENLIRVNDITFIIIKVIEISDTYATKILYNSCSDIENYETTNSEEDSEDEYTYDNEDSENEITSLSLFED